MLIHFHSDYLSEAEMRDALSVLTSGDSPPEPYEVIHFNDSMDDRLGFLLPAERGGGDAPYFYESLKLILVFAAATSLQVFVKRFLGRAGELLAERLFRPASPEHRDAAVERERTDRACWEERARDELEMMYEMEESAPSKEQVARVYGKWRTWGGESLETLEYRGDVDVTIFVEQEKKMRHFQLTFDPTIHRLLSQAPFHVSAARRFWEQAGVEFLLMLEDLERGPDAQGESRVDQQRADRRALKRALQALSHDSLKRTPSKEQPDE